MAEHDINRLQKAIVSVVEQQINDGDPPDTRETYERLTGQGYSVDEAKKLIGYVVGVEFFNVVRKDRKYDAEGFAGMLAQLPKLPWDITKHEEK